MRQYTSPIVTAPLSPEIMAGSPFCGVSQKPHAESRYTVVNRKEVGSMMLDNIPAQGTDFAAAEPPPSWTQDYRLQRGACHHWPQPFIQAARRFGLDNRKPGHVLSIIAGQKARNGPCHSSDAGLQKDVGRNDVL